MPSHEPLGIPERQLQVYARRFDGMTQKQVAADLGICQQRVAQLEAAAIKRNPQLPPVSDHRRHRTTNLSAYSTEAGTGLADILGLN